VLKIVIIGYVYTSEGTIISLLCRLIFWLLCEKKIG